MNRGLVFLLGFIAGIVFSVIGIFVLAAFIRAHRTYNDSHNAIEPQANVQYFEAKNMDGEYVVLHNGMPKDSLRILFGRPEKTDVMEIGNGTIEQWHYTRPGRSHDGVMLTIEDGKLERYMEY